MLIKISPNVNKKCDRHSEGKNNFFKEKKLRQTLNFSGFLCRSPITKDNKRLNKITKTRKVQGSCALKVIIQIKRHS